MEKSNITKYIAITTLSLLLFGCATFKPRAPYYVPYGITFPEDEAKRFANRINEVVEGYEAFEADEGLNHTYGTFSWRSDLINIHNSNVIDSATGINVNKFLPVSDVREKYRIEKKAMYENQTKIDRFLIRFAVDDNTFVTVRFSWQLKEYEYYNSNYKFESWKTVRFDENNLYSIDFYYPKDRHTYIDSLKFTHSNGTWRDYYFVTYPTDTFILKEEGKVKNNYKVGEWKYYDKEGNLTHTRQYKKSEKVDVRLPHCIWNKVEPCYCDE